MLGKSKLKKNTVDESPEKVDKINENIDETTNLIDEPKVKPVKKTTNVQSKNKGK